MPRAVAGDDEKEAMKACLAAAIRDCLKRKDSRLIIAKTKDRKVGEFEVLADAKQYKKWISEETGFDFDDKRYSKYLKETLEEMGYVLRPVNNAPNKPLTANVWSETRDEMARGIYLSPGQAPPWNDYDLLGDSKVKDLIASAWIMYFLLAPLVNGWYFARYMVFSFWSPFHGVTAKHVLNHRFILQLIKPIARIVFVIRPILRRLVRLP